MPPSMREGGKKKGDSMTMKGNNRGRNFFVPGVDSCHFKFRAAILIIELLRFSVCVDFKILLYKFVHAFAALF